MTKKTAKKKSKRSIKESPCDVDDDMPSDVSHLDWSKAVRGKYAKRFAEGYKIIIESPDRKKDR